MEDNVNNPKHYNTRESASTIELIDLFLEGKEAELNLKQGHYLATALKYLDRFPFKDDPLQDLKKAAWYLDRLMYTYEVVLRGELIERPIKEYVATLKEQVKGVQE